MLDAAARFNAPVIIGSMQGRHGGEVSKDQAHQWLAEALHDLGNHARSLGTNVFYEPLNRYESNLLNTAEETVAFLDQVQPANVKVLADLFHMNIEEASIANGLRTYGDWLGHVHLVDNHRQPAGSGQMEYADIAAALRQINYHDNLSVAVRLRYLRIPSVRCLRADDDYLPDARDPTSHRRFATRLQWRPLRYSYGRGRPIP